jgi:Flp pilus assembly protein TadG
MIGHLRADKRGAIALFFGLFMLPLILAAAFAVDYGFFIQSQAQLNLAADAAALHAIRVASNRYQNGGTVADAKAMGNTAGNQWFAAQAAKLGITTVSSVNTNVTYSTTPGGFTATVTYAGTVPTRLGSFVVPSWNVGNTAVAANQNSYVEILLMLDNSSSMQIGATAADIQQMMSITPCSKPAVFYPGLSGGNYPSILGDAYSMYECSGGGNTYDGSPACPFSPTPQPSYSYTQLPTVGAEYYGQSTGAPACNLMSKQSGVQPVMGEPCAFACHWDNSKPAGSGSDFYALARGTIGGPNPITLRFDVLKNAVNNMFTTINSKDAGSNVSVGVYAFNSSLTKYYPSGSGEAGNNMTSAQAAVGSPPTTANGADTGIQPDVLANSSAHADTNLNAAMTTLAGEVTNSGDGSTAATPQKYLILVTDGVEDDGSNATFNPSVCTTFKNMGFTVYVLNTTYMPLMHEDYMANYASYVEGTGSNGLAATLQSCATASTTNTNYISATDSAGINSAMQVFLNNALNSPTRVTK